MSHTFARQELDGTIRSYNVYDLWNIANTYNVISIDLEPFIKQINGFINTFTKDDWERVITSDLTYPIIIDINNVVLDGCHRCVKAMLLGYIEITATRISEMPTPLNIWNNWEDYDNN